MKDQVYQQWLQKRKLSIGVLNYQSLGNLPLPSFHFIIITPPNQAEKKYLTTTLNSLHAQTYPNWHWMVSNSSTLMESNSPELDHAWLVLLPAGDTIHSELLWYSARYLATHPQWRFIYTDEDICSARGHHYAPQFKPDFNLDLLRSMPYIGTLALVQGAALQAVGGYIPSPTLATYDLALKILDHYGETALGHIPHLLYHRASFNRHESPSFQSGSPSEILQQHLQRNAIQAQVYETDFPNLSCIEYALTTTPLVSIIIATHNAPLSSLQRCLRSLLDLTSYPHYEIILVDNHSTATDTRAYLEQLQRETQVHVQVMTQEENLAKINNAAALQAKGSILVFLNDDTEIIQPDWLQELLGHGLRPEVGMVGPRLLDSKHRLLQAGLIIGMGQVGIAGQINQGLLHDELGYLGRNQATQNFSALSEVCLLITKSLYLTVGGMDETMSLFNEIDFSLKIKQLGKKLVWTPFATLLQHGPGSLLRNRQHLLDTQPLETEVALMYERWLPQLSHDPAYHPRLSLTGPDWQPEISLDVPWDVNFHDRPRVVAFPYDSWGCGEYRVRAPLRALQQAGWLDYALLPEDKEEKVPTLTELARMQPDTVLLHNTLHNYHLQALTQYQRFHSSSFKVFGQDDLLYALPKTNPYRRLHYRDIKPRIRTAISHCDRLLVTTEPLAEAYQYVAEDIKIIPNYLERRQWSNLTSQRRQGRRPRVGWAGASQHQGDLQLIVPLVKTLAEKQEVEWIFFGMCPDELRPYITEYHPMVSFDQYPAKLASLNLDLALAPLENHPFNVAKSNLRILEYGIFGWPVVCSDIYPYQTAPVTRVANTPQAWLTAVQEYLHDLDAADQAGEQLRQWVLAHWMLEDHLREWGEALNLATPPGIPNFKVGPSKSKESDARVFILGGDFTSTHLLEQLLGVHPAITRLAGNTVGCLNLPHLGKLKLEEQQFWEEPLQRLKPVDIPQLWTEQETLFRYLPHSRKFPNPCQLQRRGSPLIVQTAAVNLARTLWLQQHFPNAYFIHIVRNGYVVALELREAIQNSYGPQPWLLSRTARHWARSLEILLEDAPKLERFLEIRYEDLTTDPHMVARQVFSFLNLSYCESQEWSLVSHQDSDLLTHLTAEQRAVITHSACQSLVHYGY